MVFCSRSTNYPKRKRDENMQTQNEDNSTFVELGIEEELQKELAKHAIFNPSKIQVSVIPKIMEGKDILAQSETGSGKTLSFALPVIQEAKKGKGLFALVIAPTRELALQIAEETKRFSRYKGLKVETVYGGVSIEPQIKRVPQADIAIGTPGRIRDLIGRDAIYFDNLKYLILDEADRMLDMGFEEDLNAIISELPKKRNNLLFSATISHRIQDLAKHYLNNPFIIRLENRIDPKKLRQSFYEVPGRKKFSLLTHLLRKTEHEGMISLVFCRTKHMTQTVADGLRNSEVKARALNGNMTQAQREKTLKDFKEGKANVLVATDVASRGLHIDNISHVFNYDVPTDTETYTHRIGRTARQGKSGEAITLLSDSDYDAFQPIYREFESVLVRKELPEFDSVFLNMHRDDRQRGRRPQSGGDRRGAGMRTGRSQGPRGDSRGREAFAREGSRTESKEKFGSQGNGQGRRRNQKNYEPRESTGRRQFQRR
jgi:ATP-dependent RNA helicase DeaD